MRTFFPTVLILSLVAFAPQPPPIQAPQVNIVSRGAGLYTVYFRGQQISSNSTLHTAIEMAANTALRNPTDSVEIRQTLRIVVTARGVVAPPPPVPPPAPPPPPPPPSVARFWIEPAPIRLLAADSIEVCAFLQFADSTVGMRVEGKAGSCVARLAVHVARVGGVSAALQATLDTMRGGVDSLRLISGTIGLIRPMGAGAWRAWVFGR